MSVQVENMNSLIYMAPLRVEPTRYEMIRYSTWRIYFFQELESMPTEKIDLFKKTKDSWIDKYPHLCTTDEQREYYEDLLNDFKEKTYKEDIISHFGCRLLYCHDGANHSKFVEMERLLFNIRLRRRYSSDSKNSRLSQMVLLKRILGHYLQRNPDDFNIDEKDWSNYSHKIMHKKQDIIDEYALIPVQYGQAGLRKRFSFVRKGNVYMNIDSMMELVQNLYAAFLRSKLDKMRIPVIQMLNNDVENQMSGFIRKTLQTLNSSNFDQTIINNQFKLTLKNIESLWRKFFPPCMLQLNRRLKQANHLKHEGRRQLWLFLKGCGMEVNDNTQYFRKHFASKVSASDMKSHTYNIQHAYGLVGKRQPQRPKNCRNIITGPAPKKDEHHGCPFAHWRKEQLKDFLRKNYEISEENLDEVIRQKEQNHFQVACGRLFEGVAKAEGNTTIPADITNLLGKSPHEYFQARTELVNYNNNKGVQKKEKKMPQSQKKSLEF